jgi:hypothetical protein
LNDGFSSNLSSSITNLYVCARFSGPKSEKKGMYLRSLSIQKKNALLLPLGGLLSEIQYKRSVFLATLVNYLE